MLNTYKHLKVVHPDQEYFYTKEWQKGEARADKDIDRCDVVGPFIKELQNLRAIISELID